MEVSGTNELGAAGTFDSESSLGMLQRILSYRFLFVTLNQYTFEIINCRPLYKIKKSQESMKITFLDA